MSKFEINSEELEIFKMYYQKKKIKDIALALNLSTNTICKKMKKVSEKLNAYNKIDALCKLVKMDII